MLCPLAAQQGNPTVPPIRVVDFDPNSGVFRDPLPFDLPFLVRGEAPATLERVTARYCDVTKLSAVEDCHDWIAAASSWRRTQLVSSDTFYLLFPTLDANRLYAFDFVFARKMSEAQLVAFQAAAIESIDEAFRELGDTEGLTAEENRQLQRRLVEALPRPRRDSLSIEPGSVFDERIDPHSALPAWERSIDSIVRFQIQRFEEIENFNNQLFATTSALD